MEKIGWTNHVGNKKLLYGVEEGKNILQKIKARRLS
jgi:hypothetical protein